MQRCLGWLISQALVLGVSRSIFAKDHVFIKCVGVEEGGENSEAI